MKKNNDEMIPLNIDMGYPVRWSFAKILRDLIQNFYDEIGWERFGEEIIYKCERRGKYYDLIIEVCGHPFHYEWLTFIGGSTKTEEPGKYVGKYGEGFKICMLCLLRDYDLEISMESENWFIEPCTSRRRLGNTRTEVLCYRKKNRINDGYTRLMLRGIDWWRMGVVEEGLYHFFYPQNPLFGESVFVTDSISMYRRSDMRVPCGEQATISGIFFYSYLARGRLDIPYIIHVPKADKFEDSRERKLMEVYDMIPVIYWAIRKLDAENSYKMLVALKKYWNDICRNWKDIESWYHVICQLVRNVSHSAEVAARWREEYAGDHIYIERRTTNRLRNKLIKEALDWHKEQEDSRKLINPIFRLLGVASMVEEYQEYKSSCFEGISEEYILPVQMLKDAYGGTYGERLGLPAPDVLFQKTKSGGKAGIHTFSTRVYGSRREQGRVTPSYKIEKAIMQRDSFREDGFWEAYIEYMSIIFHSFGTERSAKVNVMLTYLGDTLLVQRVFLEAINTKWVEYYKGREHYA